MQEFVFKWREKASSHTSVTQKQLVSAHQLLWSQWRHHYRGERPFLVFSTSLYIYTFCPSLGSKASRTCQWQKKPSWTWAEHDKDVGQVSSVRQLFAHWSWNLHCSCWANSDNMQPVWGVWSHVEAVNLVWDQLVMCSLLQTDHSRRVMETSDV